MRNRIPDDDDLAAFRAELQGVTPIRHDQAETGRPRTDRRQLATRRANASQPASPERVIDGLSDLFVIDAGAEDPLYWARDGVQDSQMRRLKAGQIIFDGSLDLHGLKVESARAQLWSFLAEACRHEIRCVQVTHGKAARLDGRKPLIKSHVNTWLRQHSRVLGFTSCLPRHGGTGAVYVLLRRTLLEGRDE